jgi:AcrR family transcriptional regulator
MDKAEVKEEGLRARKKRDTLQRIADVVLRLFVSNEYEETTLEEIAAKAGISKRTFFYYYKSKKRDSAGLEGHGSGCGASWGNA